MHKTIFVFCTHVMVLILFVYNVIFQVRKQDGLLQRYIKKDSGQWRQVSYQGEMMSYWYHGNNQLFVLLLSLMQEASEYRVIVDHADDQSQPDAVDEAQAFWNAAFEYFDSFHDDAQPIWEMVVSPFSQASKEEIQEFLADDDEEEEDDVGEHQALYRQSVMEEFRKSQDSDQKAAQYYERMEREVCSRIDKIEQYEESSVPSEDEDGLDDDRVDEVATEESSEEEDEWLQEKILKIETKKRSISPQKHIAPKISGRVRTKPAQKVTRKADSLSESEEVDADAGGLACRAPSSSGRKRLVIQDSDEET